MKIIKVLGREIYDSRGWPTVQCEIALEDGTWITGAAPIGMSRGKHEAVELYDGGKRLWGRGVLRAVEHVEYIIGPAILHKEVDAQQLDMLIMGLDGTADRSHLGVNAMLATSMALYRAQAHSEGVALFELIAQLLGLENVTMPFPQFNLINASIQTDTVLAMQEILVVPVGMHHFRSAMELASALFHELKALLERNRYMAMIGDEGGFVPHIPIDEAILSICEVMERISGIEESRAVIGINIAASQLYDPITATYNINKQKITRTEIIEWYHRLVDLYPIYSIENPLAEDDWEGWRILRESFGDQLQIVADNLCATNIERITRGITERAMTAVVIKPNQIGTITETLQAIKLCRDHGINTIISDCLGETNDSFIADLAVGSNAGQIKAGGFCRGERMSKYNRLLEIEDKLFSRLME